LFIVLGFGAKARVIEPVSLAARVAHERAAAAASSVPGAPRVATQSSPADDRGIAGSVAAPTPL
jgi:hypothetical protein